MRNLPPIGGFVALLLAMAAVAAALGTLELKRALPRHGVELDQLRARDGVRHTGVLKPATGGSVIDFPVGGSGDPFTFGLYFTRVQLGNPPKEFYVQIDTGSDALWVTCASCSTCPKSTTLDIQLSFFDPNQSSTASPVSCSDRDCVFAALDGEAVCPSSSPANQQCGFKFQFGDGSTASGFYVSDELRFDTVSGHHNLGNSSATVIFGCSTSESGQLAESSSAIDGIFGFGQEGISVISQLSSKGAAPKVFSHCLDGTAIGGGILILGEIVEPGIVYTPIVQSQSHYNVNMTSIVVNGETVPIDPSVFVTSSSQGTIIDSGTTLAYLPDNAYDPFVNAITSSISSSEVSSLDVKGMQCYVTASNPNDVFPPVILNFEGGVSMTIKPGDYLLDQGSVDDSAIFCMGWQKTTGKNITILGDILLKDKLFVYDLANQRIGWKDYNCSSSVNVSDGSTRKASSSVIDGGSNQLNVNGSMRRARATEIVPALLIAIVCVFLYPGRFSYYWW